MIVSTIAFRIHLFSFRTFFVLFTSSARSTFSPLHFTSHSNLLFRQFICVSCGVSLARRACIRKMLKFFIFLGFSPFPHILILDVHTKMNSPLLIDESTAQQDKRFSYLSHIYHNFLTRNTQKKCLS